MSNLEIQIEENKENFKPGEEIRGNVLWSFDNAPAPLELSLFWCTQGKGTQDAGVVQTIAVENAGASGQKEFKFIAPAGPYSFSGKLISIIWAIELATTKGSDSLRKEITISPTDQKIICTESFPDSPERKWSQTSFLL